MALFEDWKRVLSDSPDRLVRLISAGMRLSGRTLAAYLLWSLKKLRRWVRSQDMGGNKKDDYHKDAVPGELCGRGKRPSGFL